jgi:hypothetical protein
MIQAVTMPDVLVKGKGKVKDENVTHTVLRMPNELRRKLVSRAKRENRSIHGQIVFELQRALADEPDQDEPAKKD